MKACLYSLRFLNFFFPQVKLPLSTLSQTLMKYCTIIQYKTIKVLNMSHIVKSGRLKKKKNLVVRSQPRKIFLLENKYKTDL